MPKKKTKDISDMLLELNSRLDEVGTELIDKEVGLAKVKNEYYMIKSSLAMGRSVDSLGSADRRSNQLTLLMSQEDVTIRRQELEYEVMQLKREYEMLIEQSKILRALTSYEGVSYGKKN